MQNDGPVQAGNFILHFALSNLHSKDGADGETRTPEGRICPAVYETAAVAAEPRRHEMVGRHGAAPCSAV